MPKGAREVISIEADAAVPDTYGLERFMEEVNILELEGYYFSPNRKAALTRKAPTFKEVSSRPVTLLLSPYGQPGELAYKVLQAIFYKLTSEGHLTEGRVLLSRRELAQLVGRSTGGKQHEELFKALMQLNHTGVVCTLQHKQREGDTWVKRAIPVNFHIFKTAVYEGSTRGQFARCLIEVHDLVLENLRNRHISYFNWERMQGLDMVGMMLYKRFFRHMANVYRDGMDKSLLVLEKDYEQVCSQWLGLKPWAQLSRIQDQLGKRLEALKTCRLLRECRIEERVRGQGFKIVAYAGTGFFADYENIYRRRLPASVPALLSPEPLVYLNEFHKQLGHEKQDFSPKEVTCMREMLACYGDDGVRRFIDFGVKKAKATSFDVQWFGGLRTLYEGEWQVTERKRAKAQESQAVIAFCAVCNEVGMLEFEDGSVGRCPHELTMISSIHRQKPVRGFHEA
jgi:hypothetical protein